MSSKQTEMKVGTSTFQRLKFTEGLDQRPVIVWKETPGNSDKPNLDGMTFTLRRTGMTVAGVMHAEIDTDTEYKEFAALMVEVWRDRMSLRIKLATTMSGH